MNEQDQFEYEVWATYQEMTMDDVCNAIIDSPAILRAIHNNNFADVAELIKRRVDNEVRRLAEHRKYGKFVSKSINPKEEMLEYKAVISSRVNSRPDPFRSFQ